MKNRNIKYFLVPLFPLLVGCRSDIDCAPEDGVAMDVSGEIAGSTRSLDNDTFEHGMDIGIIPLKASDSSLPVGTYLADRVNCKYYYNGDEAKFLPGENAEKIIFKDATTLFRMRAYYPYSGNLGTVPEITVNTGVANQTLEMQNSTLDILGGVGMLDNGSYGTTYNITNNKVKLVFSHRMARLVLKVNISMEGGFNSEEANDMLDKATFTISGLKHTAVYKPETDVMTVSSSTAASDLVFKSENDIAGSYENRVRTFVFILIPQTVPAFTFGISYTDASSGVKNFKTSPISLDLTQGKSIVIPMKVTKREIEIGETEITDWIDSNNTDNQDLEGR